MTEPPASTHNHNASPARPSLQQMGQQIVQHWKCLGITPAAAQDDPDFHDRVQKTAAVKPLITLLRFRYATEVAPSQDGTVAPLAPRLFLSAFLCLGRDFLRHDDPVEGELHQAAKELLDGFEALCAALSSEQEADQDSTVAVRNHLRHFMELWTAYSGKFKAWKREDSAKLVEHYIATYCEVERARRSLADRCVDQVPQFLQDIRSHVQRVGGAAAIHKLEAELLQQGLTVYGLQPATEATDVTPAQQAAASPPPAAPQTAFLSDAEAKARLAYDSVCDFGPKQESNGPQAQLLEIAEKAFWDVFSAEVSATPPVYHRIPGLLQEVQAILVACAPKDPRFAEELKTTLDWDVLQHSMTTATLKGFLNFVIEKVIELEAPVHNEETRRGQATLLAELDQEFSPALVVHVLSFVMKKLRQLHEEVNRCRMQMAKAVIRDQAVDVQRQFVHMALASGKLTLTRTREWLEGTISRHFPQHPKWLCDRDKFEAVVRAGLLDLIQVPVGLQLLRLRLPEVLRYDIPNLERFQNELQHITVVACLVNIVAMLCAQKRLALSTEELQALAKRLDEALKRNDVNLAGLVDLLCEFSTQCLSIPARVAVSGGKLTPSDTDMIEAMAKKTLQNDDAVFAAFRTKVVQGLDTVMTHPPNASAEPLWPTGNLRTVEQAVRRLGGHLRTVLVNSVNVYGQYYYHMVLGIVLQADEPPEDLTRAPSVDDVERASLEGSGVFEDGEQNEAEGEVEKAKSPPSEIDEL
eukprot:TRINITY_DN2423_c0_g1_i1.p1 TRINITY_DN2423_c0_g1~~TRINITY_DN2423_c0_g1_i1.p1  ORF type:complete len:764 (+),score=137.70 TRINITY_DN2423_c0_g1_i1:37-2292(+)